MSQREKKLKCQDQQTKTLENEFSKAKTPHQQKYTQITSPATKEKLYKELIQIEVKLQKLYKESDEYKEKKACEAIKENYKFFFSYANKKRKVKSNIGPLKKQPNK